MVAQVQCLMIKKDMKSLIISFFFVGIFAFFSINCFAQSPSYYKSAEQARKIGDWEKAVTNYRLYVKQNESDSTKKYNLRMAYYEIGHCYAHGHYFKQNVDSAISYLEKSMSLDYSEAGRFLFDIYYFSNYKHIDKSKAFSYLIESAEMGNIKSLYELAGELVCHLEI